MAILLPNQVKRAAKSVADAAIIYIHTSSASDGNTPRAANVQIWRLVLHENRRRTTITIGVI